MLQPGDEAPDFMAPDQHGSIHRLADYRGRKLVLYFYPKDLTPGCTTQACDFRDNLERIRAIGAEVVGVSIDSPARHAKFARKESLDFPLLSDEDRTIVDAYGTWKHKSLYGRSFMGIERSTFVIDENGRIEAIFRKVRPKGHLKEVLDALAG